MDVASLQRNGARKGRVLVVRHGAVGNYPELVPVAVLCWHVHGGNWPLAVLDCGYRLGLDPEQGRFIVEAYLLAALAGLNDHPKLQDRKVPRPTDRLG